MYNTDNTIYLHNLNSKKNNLKNRYKNNPRPSTLFDILNILKEINSFRSKNR